MILKKAFCKINNWIRLNVPLWARILYIFTLCSVVVYVIAVNDVDFADFINEYPAAYFRAVYSKMTGVFPFSVAELVIYFLPVILGMLIYRVIKLSRENKDREITRMFAGTFAVLSIFFSFFVFTHGTGYRGSTLEDRLGLERNKVSARQLYRTAEYILNEMNEEAEKIKFDEDGFSVMPYNFAEMSYKLNEAYARVCEDYTFILSYTSNVKPVLASKIMSYAHVLGVYTYYTGEANVNIDFPDYTTPFTAAHEMSHQRGFSREDEANFMAYLVCINSDDGYIRYSGYRNMFEYIMNALYSADKEMYREIYLRQNKNIQAELKAYREFFKQYENNVVADVSNKVNDAYISMNGQSAGIRSYGLVVDLMVAYFERVHG